MPCMRNAEATEASIKSIISANVDLLLIDNGADESVKTVIRKYDTENMNVFVLRHDINIYVHGAWNEALKWFLTTDEYTIAEKYDIICIANNDFVLQYQWAEALQSNLDKYPNDIMICTNVNSLHELTIPVNVDEVNCYDATSVAGIFIILNRKQAELIYPIPEKIKIWYGDNWIYDILRGTGSRTIVVDNIKGYHYNGGSQTVSTVSGIAEIIEQDKVAWKNIIRPKMIEYIEKMNNQLNIWNKE